MKKIVTMFLALVLVFALAGCGAQGDNASGDGGNASGSDSESKIEKTVIRIAHGASESYHLHRAMLKFKDLVEQSGLFEVEIYPSSQFGNDAEMIESVKTGDLTMAIPPSSFLVDEVPALALIELPYVFPSRDAAIDTLAGEWGQKQLAELDNAGLHGLGYFENGLRHLTNSKKPVRTPEDLTGLKLRTMQVPAHVTFWNSMGSSAEGAPFAELYTNLSTKVFDGQENPVAHIYSQKFYEVQNYITLTGHVYTAYVPVVTSEFWNGLSEEAQKVISGAMDEAYAYQLQLIDDEEGQQLDEIANNETYDCEIIELTDAEKQAFINAAQPTLEKYREELGADVYDEFKKAVEASVQ